MLAKLHIKNDIQSRLVDDITLLPTVVKPGMRVVDNEMVFVEEKVEEDARVSDDLRTMRIIQSVANTIDENIQVTFDVESTNTDKMVPILDIKARYNNERRMIEYKFYRKPMVNKMLMHSESAFSMKSKITILTQECFRRLHNTSKEIGKDVKVDILNEFMEDLQRSGYNEKQRESILIGGIRTYEKLEDKEIKGDRPFYRSGRYKYENQSTVKNKNKMKTWFKQKNRNFVSVMFVDATRDDKLLKMLRETEEQFKVSDDFRIKFVPKSGVKLKQLITKRDPFQGECNLNDCLPCASITKPLGKTSKCKLNRVVYEARCRDCANAGKERIYHGETARNLYERSREHMNAFHNKSPNSFIYKHVLSEHDGETKNIVFDWKVLNKFQKPLSRQLKEALYIENKDKCVNINLKSEYFKNNTKS